MNWQGMRHLFRSIKGGGLVAIICVCMIMAGCSMLTSTKKAKVDSGSKAFHQSMIACTQAIQRGNLEKAEMHLSDARPSAKSSKQRMKIRSLQALIEGAEALMNGNGELAETHFSRIEDPYLRREVRVKARQVDLKVPITPLAAYGGGR
ncbi:hypothetical protein JD969_10195 [Planctomycetota bacterium]|nr:hypothetical protein JD969_10195 [Planctomycetota bacterium]